MIDTPNTLPAAHDALDQAQGRYNINVDQAVKESAGTQAAPPAAVASGNGDSGQQDVTPHTTLPGTDWQSTHEHDDITSRKIQLRNLRGFIEVVSVVPAAIPKNFFEQFKIYINGATKRLYLFDYKAQAWHYITLTA